MRQLVTKNIKKLASIKEPCRFITNEITLEDFWSIVHAHNIKTDNLLNKEFVPVEYNGSNITSIQFV